MSLEPAILLLGIYPQEKIKHVQTFSCSDVHCSLVCNGKKLEVIKIINKEGSLRQSGTSMQCTPM